MPETTIIFDRDDEERLISAVLREGGRLIANRHPSQNYAEITEWDAYAGARSGERLFFLLNDAYARWPLSLTRCEGGYYAGTYSVKQRWGGPTIDLLLCVEYEEEGKKWISDGSIGYYTTYYATESGSAEPPPNALVAQYAALVAEAKNGSRIIRGQSGRKYLIGRHTYDRISSGNLHIGVEGLSIPD